MAKYRETEFISEERVLVLPPSDEIKRQVVESRVKSNTGFNAEREQRGG